MKKIAVILAGGSGNRFGADKPKQFLLMPDGRTILEHSVWAFAACPEIDEICVVSRADWVEYVQTLFVDCAKVKHVVPGGKERYHSTLAALALYHEPGDVLLIHDAVRPYVSQQLISRCCLTMEHSMACAVGVPTTDTIWVARSQDAPAAIAACPSNSAPERPSIAAIPERKTLWNAQTPQCFRAELLQDAFERALRDPAFLPTDDCGVVLAYRPDVRIDILPGDPANIKITYPGDIR